MLTKSTCQRFLSCTRLIESSGLRALWALRLGLRFATTQLAMTELIAHRGASHDAPENTLASVQLAWEQGADAVEVDVHASRDGRIVVIHDASTRKTAGVRGWVRERSWSELSALEVGRWKDP